MAAKVAATVRREQQARVREDQEFRARRPSTQASYFRRTYNRPVHDPFPEEPNVKRFACLPKLPLLRNSEDGRLSYAALALYPVLCVRSDYDDDQAWMQLSRESIGRLAGLSPHTVDAGLKELLGSTMPQVPGGRLMPLLRRELVQQERRRFYLYQPNFVRLNLDEAREWSGQYLAFHGEIVDSGTWAGLSGRARALYLQARSVARFDAELYQIVEGVDFGDAERRGGFYRAYSERKWDVCDTPLARLCALGGIDSSRAARARDELGRAGLVEVIPLNGRDRVLKVYLRSRDLPQEVRRERLLEEAL